MDWTYADLFFDSRVCQLTRNLLYNQQIQYQPNTGLKFERLLETCG